MYVSKYGVTITHYKYHVLPLLLKFVLNIFRHILIMYHRITQQIYTMSTFFCLYRVI